MVKKTRFGKATKRNRRALHLRVTYISDVTHPNHIGKTILAARNYRCDDNSPEAFEQKAIELFERYDAARQGKQGKRTKKLFEEFIYSSAPHSFLADREKRLVEKAIVENGFPFVSVRTVWHDDPETGRSDLHILAAGYTDDIPPRCHLSTDFGHGKRDFLLTLERAERDALDQINRHRQPNRRILSARETKRKKMREAKIKTLAERLAGLWDGSHETLRNVLQRLGFSVTKLTKNSVSVISPETQDSNAKNGQKKPRPRRYNLNTLRENIEDIEPGIPTPIEPPKPTKQAAKTAPQTKPAEPTLPPKQRKKKTKKEPNLPPL